VSGGTAIEAPWHTRQRSEGAFCGGMCLVCSKESSPGHRDSSQRETVHRENQHSERDSRCGPWVLTAWHAMAFIWYTMRGNTELKCVLQSKGNSDMPLCHCVTYRLACHGLHLVHHEGEHDEAHANRHRCYGQPPARKAQGAHHSRPAPYALGPKPWDLNPGPPPWACGHSHAPWG